MPTLEEKLKMGLLHKELLGLLDYDPLTGVFKWKVNCSTQVKSGDIAGHMAKNGRIDIGLNGKLYKAHRLAWFYVYGYFPENNIDHIDRIPHHNWISNLREVSQICNMRNTGNNKNNVSGVKGVSWYKATEKWKVQITINSRNYTVGYYKNFDNAVCARLAVEQCLNWEGCDNLSPAYQHVQKMVNRQ